MLEGGNEAVGDIFLVYKKLRLKKKKWQLKRLQIYWIIFFP